MGELHQRNLHGSRNHPCQELTMCGARLGVFPGLGHCLPWARHARLFLPGQALFSNLHSLGCLYSQGLGRCCSLCLGCSFSLLVLDKCLLFFSDSGSNTTSSRKPSMMIPHPQKSGHTVTHFLSFTSVVINLLSAPPGLPPHHLSLGLPQREVGRPRPMSQQSSSSFLGTFSGEVGSWLPPKGAKFKGV